MLHAARCTRELQLKLSTFLAFCCPVCTMMATDDKVTWVNQFKVYVAGVYQDQKGQAIADVLYEMGLAVPLQSWVSQRGVLRFKCLSFTASHDNLEISKNLRI